MKVGQSYCNLIGHFEGQHVAQRHVLRTCREEENSQDGQRTKTGEEESEPEFGSHTGALQLLLQHDVEAAQWSQLQGQAEWVDADAHQGHDAGMLQRVQHAGLLTEL